MLLHKVCAWWAVGLDGPQLLARAWCGYGVISPLVLSPDVYIDPFRELLALSSPFVALCPPVVYCAVQCCTGAAGPIKDIRSMLDYLTRGECVRLAVRLAWYALGLLGCVFACCLCVASILGAFDVPGVLPSDRVKFARVALLLLSGIAACGAWWSIDDALRGAAFLSFGRELSLRARGGKCKGN